MNLDETDKALDNTELLNKLAELKKLLPPDVAKDIADRALGLQLPDLPFKDKQFDVHKQRMLMQPYYKERYGRALQSVLDNMIVNPKKDAFFEYKSFPRLAPSSVHNMICQSFQWLIDNDTTNVYAHLRRQLNICKRATGILIRRLDKIDANGLAMARLVDDEEVIEMPKWRMRLQEFLDNGDVGTKLEIDDLNLTDAEVSYIKIQVQTVVNVRGVIEKGRIKLLKLTDEQLAQLHKP